MFKFDNESKAPLHISFLLLICFLFSLLNFSIGWIIENPNMFEGVSKSTPGGLMLLANNGSRQLGIAILILLAIITRNKYFVLGSLIVRVVGEFLDIILYGFLMQGQITSAGIAGGMFVWEIVSIFHLLYAKKAGNA